jgi:hypothetical protein
LLLAGLLVLALPVLAACGSSKKKSAGSATTTAATIPVSISESGTKASFTLPTSAAGGVVTVELTNQGKQLHGAQFIRYDPPHTAQEALQALAKQFSGQSKTTPSWLHAEGGIGAVPPGGKAGAVVQLPAGTYMVFDAAAGGQSAGPPAYSQLTVTAGPAGSVPTLPTTITAANPSKDHYQWQISGPLTPGANTVTFVSKGAEALHQISAFRITSNVPNAQLIKDLNSNGPPPSYADTTSLYATAVIDGNKSQTTPLIFAKPGTYVLFCHLRDRTGGKYHYEEGFLTTVTVK